MTFSKNYLSNQSQPWAREVTKRIVNIENAFRSAEVNNTTRDDQLAASFRRLDQNFYDTKEANENAIDAINAVLGLGEAPEEGEEPEYPINGANIVADTITANEISSEYVYAGNISANQINAGTITGITFRTSAFGQRVQIQDNEIQIYNDSGTLVGELYGTTDPLSNQALYIDTTSSNAGFLVDAPGGVFIRGNFGVYQANASIEGSLAVRDNFTIGSTVASSGLTFYDNGDDQMEGPGFRATGNINVAGDLLASLPSGTGSDVRITSNNKLVKSSSSLRYKQDVSEAEIDYDLLASINVKTFKFKNDVIEYGEEAQKVYGFIAEELHDLGLVDFVIYEKLEDGTKRPDGIKEDSIFAATYKLVQMQGEKIKTLEQKVTELENG